MKRKSMRDATAECRVEVTPDRAFPKVGDHLESISPLTDICYDIEVAGIKSIEWGEDGAVIVVVRGWKTELGDEPPGGYNYHCDDCGAYCGAAVNPITGGPETLCYLCAEEREHKRKREEAKKWKYVEGSEVCITGGSVCVRGPGLQAIEWPDHVFSMWGQFRRCGRCGATQTRVDEAERSEKVASPAGRGV